MSGGNKRSHVLKQSRSLKLRVCITTYDLLLQSGIKRLTAFSYWLLLLALFFENNLRIH